MAVTNIDPQNISDIHSNPPAIHVAPSPHIKNTAVSTSRIMRDVLIGLTPIMILSIYLFQLYVVKQIVICVLICLATEAVLTRIRERSFTLNDYSAAVTGVILALSLPATAPAYVGVIASIMAISIGKMIFGGLGMNIFNPAMVGRAFVMIAFAGVMGASAYEFAGSIDAMSQATPMNTFKQMGTYTNLWPLLAGFTNGSPGETSALACLIGGIFLCIRKTAAWEIPLSIIATVAFIAGGIDLLNGYAGQFFFQHIMGGALMFGAFFIATDPVTSPLSTKGKIVFGIGIGGLVMLLRLFSGYPEGLMFAVLLMNAMTPLINRWTIPKPFGSN